MSLLLAFLLAYLVIGAACWATGLAAGMIREDFKSALGLLAYVTLGLVIICMYWPMGFPFLKQDLRDIAMRRG